MVSLRRVMYLASFLVVFVSSLALAGPEMPEELAAEFTQYPGSTVAHALMAEGMVQVMLNCGKEPIDTVFAYYKKTSTGKGWTVMAEMKSAEGSQLMLTKGEKQAMLVVTENDDGTAVVITTQK